MYEALEEFRKQKEQYEERLRQEARGVLEKVLKKFFEANPRILALKWKQFTPFFNDGDTCHFGIRSIDCQVSEEDQKEIKYKGDEPGWTEEGHYSFHNGSPLNKPLSELDSQLSRSKDLLEAAFGDHVWVKVTRNMVFDSDEYINHN